MADKLRDSTGKALPPLQEEDGFLDKRRRQQRDVAQNQKAQNKIKPGSNSADESWKKAQAASKAKKDNLERIKNYAIEESKKARKNSSSNTTPKKSPTSFGKSFADARRAGKKTFMWNGKSYTTKRADDKPKPKSTIESQDAKLNKSNAQQPDFTPKPVDKKVETEKVEPKKVEPKKVTRNSSTIDKIKKTMGIGRKRTAKEDMGYELQNKARASMGMKHGGSVGNTSMGKVRTAKPRNINGIAERGLTRAKHK
jgi:hypothetical protein